MNELTLNECDHVSGGITETQCIGAFAIAGAVTGAVVGYFVGDIADGIGAGLGIGGGFGGMVCHNMAA